MFNTLGNLLVNPAVGILFLGESGEQLQLTGKAQIHIHPPTLGSPEGRTIVIEIEQIIQTVDTGGTASSSRTTTSGAGSRP